MFERYTEKSRRIIFFARYEASQFGSPLIEPEHLLLGLLREDKPLTNRFLRSHASIESIRKQIEGHSKIREKVSTSVDLPLSDPSKRVLAYSAEEAERLSHKHIGPEHLLLGLMREEKSLAAEILHERGLRLSTIREELARTPHEKVHPRRESSLLSEFSRDLTQAAMDGQLDPLIGRNQELESVIEILCNRNQKNAVLIGERGVGKTAIVEGLAQRMADDEVPSFLADKRILALDLALTVAGTKYRGQFEERLKTMMKELMESQDCILFIDELHTLFGAGSLEGSLDAANILKPAMTRGAIQCITTSIPGEYRKLMQTAPWLGRCFRTINVVPLDKESTLLILKGRKEQYEKFHVVTYTDEALEYAAQHCIHYFPDNSLPKAMEILDAAGARVKLRQTSLPDELTEIQKRIKLIIRRMENAIANHEFEKARLFSDEERGEREKLSALREKYHLDEPSTAIVGPEDIEDVVARWTDVPNATLGQDQANGESPSATQAKAPASPEPQKGPHLRVFLCHASEDKPAVRDLYRRLKENQIDPWLDEENILPGQDWDYEITNAVRSSDIVIVCLSAHSSDKAGYLQREIKQVLVVAEEQPEGTIYMIPLRLEECDVPSPLRRWQWVNFFEPKGFEKLMKALHKRARAAKKPLN